MHSNIDRECSPGSKVAPNDTGGAAHFMPSAYTFLYKLRCTMRVPPESSTAKGNFLIGVAQYPF